MEEIALLKESEKRINKLKVLNHFFDFQLVVDISVRTRVIHDIFASNNTLDLNKLELFHLQYTDSLLVVLKKLKKKNEQKYLILINEININQELEKNFQKEIEKDIFLDRVKTHNLIMQAFMQSLYNDLAYENSVSVLTNLKEKNDLSNELGLEFYRKIPVEDFNKFQDIKVDSTYKVLDFEIDKKLIGKLNSQHFKFKLCCGFQCNGSFIEVYEFIHCNIHFVYLNEKKQYFIFPKNEFKSIDFSRNKSNKKEIIVYLNQRNELLKTKAEQQLKLIPVEIEQLLNDYLNKITSIKLIDDLQNIDEETNILKTMLNINIK